MSYLCRGDAYPRRVSTKSARGEKTANVGGRPPPNHSPHRLAPVDHPTIDHRKRLWDRASEIATAPFWIFLQKKFGISPQKIGSEPARRRPAIPESPSGRACAIATRHGAWLWLAHRCAGWEATYPRKPSDHRPSRNVSGDCGERSRHAAQDEEFRENVNHIDRLKLGRLRSPGIRG